MLARVSKAFTKDDAAEAPVVVPTRAPLPPGVANYVTPRGLTQLHEELGRFKDKDERARLDAAAGLEGPGPGPRPRDAAFIARLAELEARIASAVVVDPKAQPRDVVRFGARVTVRTAAGASRQYQLVGVDEADASRGLVAFFSPAARALLGHRVGDVAVLRTPRGEEEWEIIALEY
jgi:transcription elongation factor GreB